MKTNRKYIEDLAKVRDLQHGQHCYIAWSEGGGGEVWLIWGVYLLFDVPHYGGTPNWIKSYDEWQLEELVQEAYSWT